MKKKKIINPLDPYALGGSFTQGSTNANVLGMGASLASGLIPTENKDGYTSIGGSAGSGALAGLGAGAMFGPLGMAIGAGIGGIGGLIKGHMAQKQELEANSLMRQQQRSQAMQDTLSQLNSGMNNSSNIPMAYGGEMYANGGMINPVGTFSSFETGGTHEQNPYGGIPQGLNGKGQMRTVEEGEAKFKFKDGNYIFSNRLIYA